MNLILLFESDFTDSTSMRVSLRGRRRTHLLEVHRAAVGDTLTIGLLNGKVGEGTVRSINDDNVDLDVRLDREPPKPLPLLLVLALPRPKVLRRILRSAASLGVKRIVLVNSRRVEKSFWQTPFLAEENIREQLVLGLEQAKDTVLPEVLLRKRFRPFVEDELPELRAGAFGFVAHPYAAEPFPRSATGPVALAVGPEGGFIPFEVDLLEKAGFKPVSLGERILATETAVPALISRLF
jgi:RsmE family RNA methyltransferase